MAVQIQQRRDTAANWASVNPVLAEGELGWELDTGKAKLGNGADDWTTLGYVVDPTGGGGGGGSGDVVGPSGAVNNRLAVFDGATGKLIKDGGVTVAELRGDAITAASISGGTVTLDCAAGVARNFTISMTGNSTLAVSNLAPAGRVTEFECLISQDATGGRTLTLPASFRALGGSDTAIASAANAKTLLSAKTFDAGSTWAYAMQELA